MRKIPRETLMVHIVFTLRHVLNRNGDKEASRKGEA